jgi:hypothetical protein
MDNYDYRKDNRNDEQFAQDILLSNKEEKIVASAWQDIHNASLSKKPHRNVSLRFIHLDKDGSVDKSDQFKAKPDYYLEMRFKNGSKIISLDLKLRHFKGDTFRPKASDVDRCLKYNIAYVLIQNFGETNQYMVFLSKEDLKEIKKRKQRRDKKYYGGKPHYLVESFRKYTYCKWLDFESEAYGKGLRILLEYKTD